MADRFLWLQALQWHEGAHRQRPAGGAGWRVCTSRPGTSSQPQPGRVQGRKRIRSAAGSPTDPAGFLGWLTPDTGQPLRGPAEALASLPSLLGVSSPVPQRTPVTHLRAELRVGVSLARPPLWPRFLKMKKGHLCRVMVLAVRQAPQRSPQPELAPQLTLAWRSAVSEE